MRLRSVKTCVNVHAVACVLVCADSVPLWAITEVSTLLIFALLILQP